jgi:hypothetical protein
MLCLEPSLYRLTIVCSLAQRLQRSFIICFLHVKKTKKLCGVGVSKFTEGGNIFIYVPVHLNCAGIYHS